MKKATLSVIVLLTALFGSIVFFRLKNDMKNSLIQVNAESFLMFMDNYKKEYGHNPSNVESLGFRPEGAGIDIYLNEHEIPQNIERILYETELPYVTEKDYRALLVLSLEGRVMEIWILSSPNKYPTLLRTLDY